MGNLNTYAQLHLDSTTSVKAIKLVDKTRRAFSISIDSSKAFELAIRKPRRKLKHTITNIRAAIYSVYLLLMKHHGSPPGAKDLSLLFAFYGSLVAIDVMMLINYTIHIFIPYTNFTHFGWAFFFVIFMVPYLAPILSVIGCATGSDQLLKTVGNLNSIMITINLPLTVFFSWMSNEDPVYYLFIIVMIAVKVFQSSAVAKVRMFLINPRYS
jgi:hypothetical protein